MATSRKVIVIFCIAAIVAIYGLVLNIGMARAAHIIFVGPGETYTSIQSAVNVSNPFDTIIVRDGTYNENIDVTVDNVTILSENGSANCFVHALDQNDHVFEVTADYVNIRGFKVQDAVAGIYLDNVDHCTISENIAVDNGYGIWLSSSSNNTLTGNTANSNAHGGIYLFSSSSSNLTNNIMVWDGIIIEGNQLQHWNTYSIDTSNTVNGKPVYYWKDQVGGTVPSGAGQVILANCTNVVVENQIVSDGSAGICLGFSSNNTIANNTASNNLSGTWKTTDLQLDKLSGNVEGETSSTLAMSPTFTPSPMPTLGNGGNGGNGGGHISVGAPRFGIYLSSSSTNKIANNTASNNSDYGIWLEFSSNNTLTSNIANSNSYDGIFLYSSSNNFLTGNTASDNYNGIFLISSSNNNILTRNIANSNKNYGICLLGASDNNHIYNNYFNNTKNAWDNGNNIWNITKTEGKNILGSDWLGGNYWSDYSGEDFDGDGIGDTMLPYNSSGGLQNGGDWLPLIKKPQQDVLKLEENASYVLNLETGSKQTYAGFLNSEQLEGDRLEFTIYVSKTGNPILDDYVLELRTNLDNPYWKFGDEICHAATVLTWKGRDAHEALVPKIVLSGEVPKPGEVYVELTVGTTKDGATLATIIQKLEPSMVFFSVTFTFDTHEGSYPSISGTFSGTIAPSCNLSVSKLYTYPCPGTGGHLEYVRIWNGPLTIAEESWNGYTDDWHNISFNNSFVLYKDETYNYTIRTGSYPQIIHESPFNATGGTITCTEFTDANGKRYEDWIPAIRLS